MDGSPCRVHHLFTATQSPLLVTASRLTHGAFMSSPLAVKNNKWFRSWSEDASLRLMISFSIIAHLWHIQQNFNASQPAEKSWQSSKCQKIKEPVIPASNAYALNASAAPCSYAPALQLASYQTLRDHHFVIFYSKKDEGCWQLPL